jgi:UDP-glucose 4-epimerase
MIAPTRLLVTGASGFLGREIVREFAAAGYSVRRALRRQDQLGGVVVGEIDGTTDWSAALVDVDAIVHLAALAHRDVRYQIEHADCYRAVNVEGTRNLAQQAIEHGIRRMVFVSSIGVHGLSTDNQGPFSEASPLRPVSPYARSKIEAEEALSRLASERFSIAALRVPLVYGADAPGNLKLLLRAINNGWPLPLASARNRRAFAAPELLGSFVSHWLNRPSTGFEPFILAHAEQISTADFVRELGNALGRPARLVPFPTSVLFGCLKAIGRTDTAHGLFSSLQVDLTKALSTGWQPQFALSEGLESAFARA